MMLSIAAFMLIGGILGAGCYWFFDIHQPSLLFFAFYGGAMLGAVAWMTIREIVLKFEKPGRRKVRQN